MVNETELKIIQELFLCPIDKEKFDFFERKPLVLVPCGHCICLKCKEAMKTTKCALCQSQIDCSVINQVIMKGLSFSSNFVTEKIKKSLLPVWSWEDNEKNYNQFLEADQNIIEDAFKEYLKDPKKKEYEFTCNIFDGINENFRLDFQKMNQINNLTHSTRNLTREVSPVEASPVWFYRADKHYKEFEDSIQNTLEELFQSYLKGGDSTVEIAIPLRFLKYELDFAKFLQRNTETGTLRKIYRYINRDDKIV